MSGLSKFKLKLVSILIEGGFDVPKNENSLYMVDVLLVPAVVYHLARAGCSQVSPKFLDNLCVEK